MFLKQYNMEYLFSIGLLLYKRHPRPVEWA